MKSLIVGLLICTSLTVVADENLSQRLQQLEQRLNALESAVKSKGCVMRFKKYSVRHTVCDKGTFAYGAYVISGNTLQLSCGYYQLDCRNGQEKEKATLDFLEIE